MQVLSATSAISPAIDRTKKFLFQNIRFGTFLKLCLVAVLTEGSGGSGNFHIPSRHHMHTFGVASLVPFVPPGGFRLTPAWFAFILAAIVLVIAIALVISYLITRLRFAYFHCLIHGTREIRPGWRLYDRQSWRFFLLNVAAGAAFLLLVLLLAVPFLFGFIRFFEATRANHDFDLAGFLAIFLPLIPVVLLVIVLAIALEIVLHDFMLPHYALENATAGEAWQAVCRRIAAEKGAFLLYGLLRIVLPLAACIAAFFVLLIPLFIFAAVGFAALLGLHSLIAGATGAVHPLLVGAVAVLAAAAAVLTFLLILAIGGPIGTWTRTYALLFYGGRYQPLGDILEPPAAPQAAEPPSLPA